MELVPSQQNQAGKQCRFSLMVSQGAKENPSNIEWQVSEAFP